MKLSVDCPGGDIVIRTRTEISCTGHLLDIFSHDPIVAPVTIAGWTFVVIPVGYTKPLDFINELVAPIVVTWSRDAIESIPDFKGGFYSITRIVPYLIIIPGEAMWEISQEYDRPPRALMRTREDITTFTITRAGGQSEFDVARGVNYIDARGLSILHDVLPKETKTQRWLASKSIAWASVVAEHVDTTQVKETAHNLQNILEKLSRAGGGGKSVSQRDALLLQRDSLITALESYDIEINSIEVTTTRASAADLAQALGGITVSKPTAPPPAPFNMDVSAARARLEEIAAVLSQPGPIIPPTIMIPRPIDLTKFDPAAKEAAEKYNAGLAAEIARGEARAADAKIARVEHARRIGLEAEAAKIKAGLASVALAAQWQQYRTWKCTAGATAAEYEAAVVSERARARRSELITARATYLQELLAVEREIGANRAVISSAEYRDLHTQYFEASERHKAAVKEYRARPIFITDTNPADDRAKKAIALASITRVDHVVLKTAPSPTVLATLRAVVPYIFIVDYNAADWFLPTRESPVGTYLGRLVPIAAPTITCPCGKTYKNYRKHIESAAHKKYANNA